ncbi:hypothetical protein [Accumulibacter sp.]|uniref:hypothetical protein n=1 Tax=Accumulibacter sp. TaxID=2053492 RepID=UPI0025E391D4|nr:hypothetical protein [Accumulibacter sp.]MCM8611420.1 hypothetical protein [Accumulibacter sp.]MCM8634933.1 hypothetical protein [Accumulibacter sp.]MCM8638548.1 hypothetical protein [Accumulibacter sp.]
MSHDAAHQIIDEFLQAADSSAQARRNAAVALATIADDTALQRLLRLAIGDADGSVRATAEAELATLCRQSPANLGRAMAATLAGSEQAPAAYALLGRLQAQGASLPPLPAALPWLQLALSLFRQARGAAGWWSRSVRAMVPGLFTALLGVLAALAYMQWLAEISLRSEHDVVGPLVASLLFIAGPLIAFGTWRTTPYRLHPRRGSGALAEIAWAGLHTAAPGVVCVAAILLEDSRGALADPEDWVIAGMLLLLPPIVAAAIRAGTVVADGALGSCRRLVGGSFASIVGAAAGLVCVTLATSLFHGISSSVCSQVWIWWLPICFGLAGAYAWIDARVPAAPGAAADSQRLTISAVVLGVFLVGALIPVVRASGGILGLATPLASLDVAALETRPATIPLRSLPARIDLRLRGGERWNLIVDIEPPPAEESGVYLWRARTRLPLQQVAAGSIHEIGGTSSSTLLFFERNLDQLLRDSQALGAFLDAWWGRQSVPPVRPGNGSETPTEPRVVKLSAFPVAPTIHFGSKQ